MLLMLAGTGEARKIATLLEREGVPSLASISGATREPATLAIKTRTGGFGGAVACRAFLLENKITAILDATHPFAANISTRTALLAQELSLPYLQVLRPPWEPETGDLWQPVENETCVARYIPKGSTVFLATGRQTLKGFDNLSGRRLILRQIDPPDAPFPYENGGYIIGRPPFSVADEVSLFKKLGVDWLVVKNAGGQASQSKLLAARELQIPVAMINRPKQPDAQSVQTVDQAMQWVRALPW